MIITTFTAQYEQEWLHHHIIVVLNQTCGTALTL